MRSPYETESAIDEAAIGRWNERNQRAGEEYDAHPIAACLLPLCDELARSDDRYCWYHECHTAGCRRIRDGRHSRCWTCRKGGPEQAAARMRRRRRGEAS